MSFSVEEPAFVFLACALGLGALGLYGLKRRLAPALFVLGAALFALLGSGLSAGGRAQSAQHAAVLDVSGSMEARLAQARPALESELAAWPETTRMQLSGALRAWGDPPGGLTNFKALAALNKDEKFNGELVLMTDGRGRLDELLGALDPSRVVLLRAPKPAVADAAIVAIRGPSLLLPGATGTLNAEVVCDRDAEVAWRVSHGAEASGGKLSLKAGISQTITHVFRAADSGQMRLNVTLELTGDREPRNDSASLGVQVGGKRVILYCRDSSVAEAGDALLALLRSDSLNELRVQGKLPASASELEGIAAVVINDLPLLAGEVTREGLGPLAKYVRDGGRLMMAGARGAFGPGGYRGTEIEDLMPVTFRPDDDPPRRTVLLLDCSDSMRAAVGGQTRLDLLKQAALRVIARLGARDVAAIVGFSQAPDAIEFSGNRRELEARVASLTPRGTTKILSATEAALAAFRPGSEDRGRIILITDGDDSEGGETDRWRNAARAAARAGVGTDIVLTVPIERPWQGVFRAAGAPGVTTSVGASGFGEILDALERALAASEQSQIDDGSAHGGFIVESVAAPLRVLCRTSARAELRAADRLLEARTPPGEWKQGSWPLLARREMVGRSVVLCTETYGGLLWSDPGFLGDKSRGLQGALGFLLSGTERANLQLVARDTGAELIWIGAGAAPDSDLRMSTGGVARLVSSGRWELAEYPQGDSAQVLAGEKLIQRLALARFPSRELALTGDDQLFFAAAEKRGIRVVNSLSGWNPQHAPGAEPVKFNLGWLAAALGMACLLAGYWISRR